MPTALQGIGLQHRGRRQPLVLALGGLAPRAVERLCACGPRGDDLIDAFLAEFQLDERLAQVRAAELRLAGFPAGEVGGAEVVLGGFWAGQVVGERFGGCGGEVLGGGFVRRGSWEERAGDGEDAFHPFGVMLLGLEGPGDGDEVGGLGGDSRGGCWLGCEGG